MNKIWTAVIIGLGAVGGFSYYYFVGCNSGVCPITSNPFTSTLYGGLLGFVMAASLPAKSPKNSMKDDQT